LTAKKLQLALPAYHSTLASDPLDVEQKKGRHWNEIPLGNAGPKPKSSPEINPGETIESKFDVVGAGQ
jgi:hypothetical protein